LVPHHHHHDDNRIRLTSIQHGVLFDLIPDGHPEPVSWTRAESDDAFLALDRNHNGLIDDSRELFGTTTNQPPNPDRNGFLALAVFDENGDGRIDSHDAIFAQLVLWFDRNHNGRSEPGELVSLAEAGVVSINLHYHISNRTDEHGNHFRYVSDVRQRVGDHVITRRAIDVLLATP
jgi:hypothetical protein